MIGIEYNTRLKSIRAGAKDADLSSHIITDISENGLFSVEISSIVFADAPPLRRPLKAYLLKQFSDEDKQEINAAQENARAEQMADIMNGVDPDILAFINTLNWPHGLLAPELIQLGLKTADSDDDRRINELKNELAARLNEMYLNDGYLSHDGTDLLQIPSADTRKIRELRGEDDFMSGSSVYISDKNKSFDQECISGLGNLLVAPSVVKIIRKDGDTHIDCGQYKMQLKETYPSKNNAYITMPSLSVLFTVVDNIYGKLIERFNSNPPEADNVLNAILTRQLNPILEQYGIYWIETSKYQRAAIEGLTPENKALFEPYLLPDNIKTIDAAKAYFVKYYHGRVKRENSEKIEKLNKKQDDTAAKFLEYHQKLEQALNKAKDQAPPRQVEQ